ncbi:MAG: TIGR03936 family radical SAM-associated protein [Cellulosilyticaceae bacterium]
MRIRGKFTKQGKVKFVGHLDTMRLFQRAIKVARIPIAYSQGFNPHALVYFAMPLSVGVSSIGEYIDIVTDQDVDIEETKARLNEVLVNEIQILDMYEVAERAESLMSMVGAADYQITIPKDSVESDFEKYFDDQLAKDGLLVQKKSKKKFIEVDVKPLVMNYSIEITENDYIINLNLYAGSKQNLSPELLLKAVLGAKLEEIPYCIERIELYAEKDDQFTPIYTCERV